MRESVHTGAHQVLRVVQVVYVSHRPEPQLVGLCDDRAVDLGGELAARPVAVVDPELDDVGVGLGQPADVEPRLLGRRGFEHDVGREERTAVRGPRRGRHDPRPRREEQGQIRVDEEPRALLVADRDLGSVAVRAQRLDDAHAIVHRTTKMVEHVLPAVLLARGLGTAQVSHVPMHVDERRHHRRTGQVHGLGVLRLLDGAAGSDRRDEPVPHDDHGILDRRGSVARDDAGAVEDPYRAPRLFPGLAPARAQERRPEQRRRHLRSHHAAPRWFPEAGPPSDPSPGPRGAAGRHAPGDRLRGAVAMPRARGLDRARLAPHASHRKAASTDPQATGTARLSSRGQARRSARVTASAVEHPIAKPWRELRIPADNR